MATLSKKSIVALTDLVEIKMSCMQVFDRDDARELATLEQARRELVALLPAGKRGSTVVPFPAEGDEAPERGEIQATA